MWMHGCSRVNLLIQFAHTNTIQQLTGGWTMMRSCATAPTYKPRHNGLFPLFWLLQLEGVQPLLSPDDCFDAEAIVKGDAGVVELLASRYGLTDLALVACDPWSVHAAPQDGRLVQLFMYNRSW
jgi:hypothetical protein